MVFTCDALGTGTFDSEAALDQSRMIQRPRKWLGDLLDFRQDAYLSHKVVHLVGGPYDGKLAAVNDRQTNAWVIGDYSYRQDDTGRWRWYFEAFA
jgi:hypothetical protein